jgi:hypothetical protein
MLIVAIVIAALLVLAWVGLTFFVKQKQSQGVERVRDALGGADAVRAFEAKATCRGTESGPFNNLLGMGALGYNGDELLFVRWSPEAELRISASDVVSHTFVTEYAGKDYRKPLLQVTYKNPEHTEGETPGQDVVAWEVEDPDAWDAALES